MRRRNKSSICRWTQKWAALIIVLTNLAIFVTSGFAVEAGTNAEPAFALTLTNFIDFVKDPPAINTLVFRRILYIKPRVFFSSKDAKKFLSSQSGKSPGPNTSDLLFALRYQSPDNFMFQEIDFPTNAWSKSTRLKTFAGRDGGAWWDLKKKGAILTDATNGIYQMNGEDNDTFPTIYRFATEPLHLGMFDLQPDSIRESAANEPRSADEMRFTGRTTYGGTIDGVAVASNGLITAIQYKILDQGGLVQGRAIQVTHKDGNLKSIQVSNIVKDQSAPVLYCRYEVISVSISTEANQGGSCSVNQFLTDSDREVLIKKDGQMLNLRRKMRPVIDHRTNEGMGNQSKRLIVRSLFIAILVVPFFVIWACGKNKIRLTQPN